MIIAWAAQVLAVVAACGWGLAGWIFAVLLGGTAVEVMVVNASGCVTAIATKKPEAVVMRRLGFAVLGTIAACWVNMALLPAWLGVIASVVTAFTLVALLLRDLGEAVRARSRKGRPKTRRPASRSTRTRATAARARKRAR